VTRPRDKGESRWLTLLRGLRVSSRPRNRKLKAWGKRRLSKARRRRERFYAPDAD